VIQACGRVVRAPDDYGSTYLADSSLLDLFERARADTPDWFQAQIDRLSEPDLPEFSPVDALGGESVEGEDGGSESRTSGRSRSRSRSGSRAGSRSRSGASTRSSPMADVWDTE